MGKVNSYEVMEITLDATGDGEGLLVTFKWPSDSPDKATMEFNSYCEDDVSERTCVSSPPAVLASEALRLFLDKYPFAFDHADAGEAPDKPE